MDQNQTPLLDALERFERDRPAFFRIPGHRYERGISGRLRNMMGDGVFRFDLTELRGWTISIIRRERSWRHSGWRQSCTERIGAGFL
ncbi:hypothetical protein DXA96_04265 [Lachnospiraceae bacterium OF09-33XD]|nr:hypothetical protein DXA96_04265 [Lachnospiraceae bacterium OF09-33XD]